MNNKILSEMISKDFEGYTKDELANAMVFASAAKGNYDNVQKQIKAKLQTLMTVGEQLSLDFGPKDYKVSLKEKTAYSFDISEDDLYSIAQAEAPLYCINIFNTAGAIDAYKKGSLPSCLSDHIVISKEETLSMNSTQKKGE